MMPQPTTKPMLAKKLIEIKPEKLQFPYIAQKKYNGLRCMAEYNVYTLGTGLFKEEVPAVFLFSKNGNPYLLDHIIDYIIQFHRNPKYESIVFDGELYVHGETINIIKKRVPMILPTGTTTVASLQPDPVQYILYDLYDKNRPFLCQADRLKLLQDIYEEADIWNKLPSIILAESEIANSVEEAYTLRDKYISQGYEGAMLRDPKGVYSPKRVSALIKVKKVHETECLILDIVDDGFKSGRENIGFILRNDRNDEVFKATPGDLDNSWTNEYKREIFENRGEYIGKLATITFYERSGVKQVPFQGNLKTIRDYE